jgi:toxin ParE1/3/4
MPTKVRRSDRASQDLAEIWWYIVRNNRAAADELIRRFDGVFQMLARHPAAGRTRPDLGSDLRSFSVGRYLVFYRVDDDWLDIRSRTARRPGHHSGNVRQRCR